MELTENALKVLRARYLFKDEKGDVIETPEKMFERVAKTVSSAESLYKGNTVEWEEKFYTLMTDLKFLPNSPTLMNAGKDMGQLAACFVLPVGDSINSIFDTLKNAALILQSGGGTGFSFSRLRPKADIVRSTGGIASGPVSFMRIYNTATEVIKQGGARRGANMGILRIDHPDILEFIKIKRSEGELTNFNISVAVTDIFMDALKNNEEYELINPRSKVVVGKLKARVVFDEMVESAWETGDPGIIFIDRINRANPTPHIGTMESTNPCGEQPLLPYEACVLGSMNLSKYVKDSKRYIEWDALSRDIRTAVRFLDNSIDVNKYPIQKIEEMHKGNRKIGLGVMGWADMLILLNIPYNHKEAFSLARDLMRFVRATAREASVELAEIKGVFPNFKGSIYDFQGMPRVRNATTTTIAPTGTLSIISDCSSGIEPIFALAYKRLILDSELYEINRYFFEIAKDKGFYSEEMEKKVIEKGHLRGIKEIPNEIKRLFKTAHEIHPEDHIEMQASFQEYTDNAVSKTINMPYRSKKEDVARAFLLAYEKGCKGITIFRSGTAKKGTLVRFSDTD
ncbi:MAG: ribonucleoside-diphosphate reductase, adenosylcobalamin-dependent [Nitrospirae bacterium CG_4_10_14_0_8_um_filter_41_23]|nr:adenosylcobalamin-dependent ribonucleoside-diphosphate reductase [Nitrospirota bacterium]OIP58552.1 MAG: ribonucleoside-diphosphate reductase, adenosylcobalamin-dependent [Nitrospirae bacterium CG2_30_41_42]PIQ93137.1 MAG: ribonucleoside-diphosphate reductase, adenosylcobalamin-dependent [Nitrospirae bacterium CG11_big_fil_rev_8_21_14_0_20_41_14]PIY87713.1 MAG: ribonucleoside-diphosphate reductase, adenosylcobalamin-dependent [Nitrospirae bacterium CG_4_10_14_0_8_um_filter_41_23]PJA78700.1 M